MANKQAIVRLLVGLVLVLVMATACCFVPNANAEPEKANPPRCVGADLQKDLCQCDTAKPEHNCVCGEQCTGDSECACIRAANESTGIITGTVKLWRARAKLKGSKSYKDVVVYLEKVGDNDVPAAQKPTLIDQKGLVFLPHVTVVPKGTPLEFLNSDNDKHNVYFLYDITKGKTQTKDLGTWNPGDKRSYTFDEPKIVTMLCKLHLEMAAYIVVLDNPFFTRTIIKGKPQTATFTIKNIPPGKYVLNVWHKKLKLKTGSQEVTVQKGITTKVDLVITKAKYVMKKPDQPKFDKLTLMKKKAS